MTPLTFEIDFALITRQYDQGGCNTPSTSSSKEAVLVSCLFAATSYICNIMHTSKKFMQRKEWSWRKLLLSEVAGHLFFPFKFVSLPAKLSGGRDGYG